MIRQVLLGLCLLVSGASAQTLSDGNPPDLTVQVVDHVWEPLPGAEVVVKERIHTRAVRKAVTDKDGLAHFRLAPADHLQTYDVIASLRGFKKSELKKVSLGPCIDCPPRRARHIQLRLRLNAPTVTITE